MKKVIYGMVEILPKNILYSMCVYINRNNRNCATLACSIVEEKEKCMWCGCPSLSVWRACNVER